MYGFCLKGGQVKLFMNDFLRGEAFDSFVVKRLEVFSVAKFETDGRINPDFLPEGEERDFCVWKDLKPYAYGLIKGKIKPKLIKAVLALTPDKAEILNSNAASMHLTVVFENEIISFYTGTSQKNFSLDKEVDAAWERYVKAFFKKLGYACETLE